MQVGVERRRRDDGEALKAGCGNHGLSGAAASRPLPPPVAACRFVWHSAPRPRIQTPFSFRHCSLPLCPRHSPAAPRRLSPLRSKPRVYFDITIGGRPAGRTGEP